MALRRLIAKVSIYPRVDLIWGLLGLVEVSQNQIRGRRMKQ